MADRQIIDVHCHLFNAQYAIMELAAATWNHLWGNYPHQKSVARKRPARGVLETLQGAKDFAAWIARLLEVASSDCEGNYNTAQENFAQSALGKTGSLVVTPLMMDIYFALDDNKDEEEVRRGGRRAAPVTAAFAIPDDQQEPFEAHLNNIKNLIRGEMPGVPAIKRRSSSDQSAGRRF